MHFRFASPPRVAMLVDGYAPAAPAPPAQIMPLSLADVSGIA
jgi:hypothetical protein